MRSKSSAASLVNSGNEAKPPLVASFQCSRYVKKYSKHDHAKRAQQSKAITSFVKGYWGNKSEFRRWVVMKAAWVLSV